MTTRYTQGWELHNANIKTNLGAIDVDLNSTTAGAVPSAQAATVSVSESCDGILHQTTFTFADVPITMRDTEQGGGSQIYTFPKGRILYLGGSGQITPTTTSAIATTLNGGKTCNWGVGTTTQANATLATTEQDLIQVAAFVSSTVIATAPAASTAGVGLAILTPYTGISTATKMYLNLAVNGAEDIDGNATITVDGAVTMTWINVGSL